MVPLEAIKTEGRDDMERRHGILLGLVALATLVAVASALAGSTLTVPVGKKESGSAKCGDNEVATGGGHSAGATTRWDVLVSQPRGRRWEATLRNVGSSQQKAKIKVVCGKASRYSVKSKRVTETVPAFGGVTGEVDVKCPAGTTVAGGGLGPTDTPSKTIAVLDSAPKNDRTWSIRVYSHAGSTETDITFRARAVCDRTGADYVVRSLSFAEDPPRAARGTAVPFDESVACSGSSRLTSGGFASDNINANYTRIQPDGNGWRLAGTTQTSDPMTVYALCRKAS
jgi:hypothetical protein